MRIEDGMPDASLDAATRPGTAPITAQDHVARSDRGAVDDPGALARLTADALATGSTGPIDFDGGDATRPVSIVARRRLGDTGLTVFPLALDAAQLGSSVAPRTAVAVLDRFEELGGDLLDLDDGAGAEVVGAWSAGRRNRDHLTLSVRVGGHPERAGLGQVALVRAAEAALTALRTDHVELLVLDGPDPGTRLEDTLATAEWLVESGKTRFVGARGLPPEQLMAARILSSTGLPRLSALETTYDLMQRAAFESAALVVASAQELAVLPRSGLVDRLLRSAGDPARPRRGALGHGRRPSRILHALERIAADHGRQTATIALAWLLARRSVVAPIAAALTPAHVAAVVDAAAVRLSRSQMVELDRASEER